jgi:hypothetical protein
MGAISSMLENDLNLCKPDFGFIFFSFQGYGGSSLVPVDPFLLLLKIEKKSRLTQPSLS